MAHVLIVTGCSGLALVFWKLVKTGSIGKYEIIGTLIAVGGGCFLILDAQASKTYTEGVNPLLGYIYAALSCITAAIMFVTNKAIARDIHPLFYSFNMSVYSTVLAFFICPYVFNDIDWSMDRTIGFFGWLQPESI